MKREFSALNGEFDLLVCGGGIYGAWTAYDAALRGLRVALVEQRDWASATSSASSKLIHGGLRYLETYDFKLVRKALRERRMLLQAAPHRVWPLRFGVPVYADSRNGTLKLKAGLTLYDTLAGFPDDPMRHHHFDHAHFSEHFPFLDDATLKGGFTYGDAQTDDARLVLELVAGAMAHGAVCVNYARLVKWKEDRGRVCGATVQDAVSDATAHVHARQYVSTAGQWTTATEQGRAWCRLSKGIHLVLPALPTSEAILLTAKSDGRVFFIIPWYGRTLLGTTDTDYRGDIDHVTVEAEEVDYLLAAANRYLKTAWTKENVIGSYAGVRVMKPSDATASFCGQPRLGIENSGQRTASRYRRQAHLGARRCDRHCRRGVRAPWSGCCLCHQWQGFSMEAAAGFCRLVGRDYRAGTTTRYRCRVCKMADASPWQSYRSGIRSRQRGATTGGAHRARASIHLCRSVVVCTRRDGCSSIRLVAPSHAVADPGKTGRGRTAPFCRVAVAVAGLGCQQNDAGGGGLPAMIVAAALDLGTTGIKAGLLSQDGTLGGIVSRHAPRLSADGGRYESDALAYAETADTVLAECLAQTDAPDMPLGLCCQRSSFLIWERASGKPVTPLISWQDDRGAESCAALRDREGMMRELSGLPLTPYYLAPKLRVLLQSNPSWRERLLSGAWLLGTLDTFLIWRWTGGKQHVIDVSMAARTLLLDIHSQQWSPVLCELFGIPLQILPQVRPSAGMGLHLENGLILQASLGDQSAALVASISAGQPEALVNLGTGGFVVCYLPENKYEPDGYLQTLVWQDAARQVHLASEGTLNSIAAALKPYPAKACRVDELASDDIFCLAEPSGLGAPYFRSDLGLTFSEPVEHLPPQRMALLLQEGIIFRVTRILEDFQREFGIERVYLSGGLSGLPCLQLGIAQCVPFAAYRLLQTDSQPERCGAAGGRHGVDRGQKG